MRTPTEGALLWATQAFTELSLAFQTVPLCHLLVNLDLPPSGAHC